MCYNRNPDDRLGVLCDEPFGRRGRPLVASTEPSTQEEEPLVLDTTLSSEELETKPSPLT